MEYQQNPQATTSANQPHWFSITDMQEYRPPATTHYTSLLGPSVLIEKYHTLSSQQTQNHQGCKFDKSKRVSPFKGNKETPGAGHYFKHEHKVVKDSNRKQLTLSRNTSKEQKPTAGVGDYNIYDINKSISFNKSSTVTTKDQKIAYFDLKAL